MIDQVKKALGFASEAIARVEAAERLLESVKDYQSFGLITKDGITHLVLLNDEQAKVVNGLSIKVDNLPALKEEVFNLIMKQIEASVAKDRQVLKPFISAGGTPATGTTGGVGATTTKTV